MIKGIALALAVTFLLIPADSFAQQESVKVLTLEEAKRIADAAEERARQDKWTVLITVVDSGGHLLLLRRTDGTQLAV